jgi:hypothetical protein
MSPAMGRRPLRLVIGLLVLCSVVLAGAPAHACSCVRMDVGARLGEVDGAFVGVWVDRALVGSGQAAVTFDVERVVKGAFGPEAIVLTHEQGSACGLELLGTPRTGLLLTMSHDGRWHSDLCSMVDPEALLAVDAGDPPDPSIEPIGAGMGPLARTALWALGGASLVAATVLVLRRRPAAGPGSGPEAR